MDHLRPDPKQAERLLRPRPIRNACRRVGRNETCPFCSSGKKFKKCCGGPKEGTPPGPIPFTREVPNA